MSIALVGIGSQVRTDDAIGLRLVENLSGHDGVQTHLWNDRDALDLASLLLDLDAPVLLVDCAQMGIEPGQGRAFGLQDAILKRHASTMSTHGFGLSEALGLAQQLGFSWPVRFFAVQPFELQLASGLSAPMQQALAGLQAQLLREVQGIGITVTLRGRVQGVGMRPSLKILADAAGLEGWVQNCSGSVKLRLNGPRGFVQAFLTSLPDNLPAHAQIDAVHRGPEEAPDKQTGFYIKESLDDHSPGAVVPADLMVCAECIKDVFDPDSRRYAYAFTTCTHCGPRYSVVTGTPYDRAQTTLAAFPLCKDCAREYGDPEDRRFHAQSIACPKCGPQLQAIAPDGTILEDPLRTTRAALQHGNIIAIRGIGGFQLAVDAHNRESIDRLRLLKNRPHRPLALMAKDMSVVQALCESDPQERQALQSPAGPIVLLRPKDPCALPIDLLSPDAGTLGIMLATSPLHALLFEPVGDDSTPAFDLLVMTSGNRCSEPICTGIKEARQQLNFVDLFLMHNREISLRCDDSVLAYQAGNLQILRRARGLAPEPILLDRPLDRPVLALGAGFKNTVALGFEDQVVVSAHLSDPDTPQAFEMLEHMARRLPDFLKRRPEAVAVDLHPDLASTRLGERLASEFGVELVRVQHHRAHAVSVMAEAGVDEALALVFDGVGFGEDGELWGGELLHVKRNTFERIGGFAPAPLPGGDAAVREPMRQVVGRCFAANIELPTELQTEAGRIWSRQCEKGVNAPKSRAVGRLFDATAAALGLAPKYVTWQGQAAVRLEAAARRATGPVPDLEFEVQQGTIYWQGAWEKLMTAGPANEWALAFHIALARSAAQLIRYGLKTVGSLPIVISGGVFQNGLLLQLLQDEFAPETLLMNRKFPCNDGGISLGQVLVAGSTKPCV